jgi:hypothetical protein
MGRVKPSSNKLIARFGKSFSVRLLSLVLRARAGLGIVQVFGPASIS